MPKYRHNLPQLDSRKYYITDGGLETNLIFKYGINLPEFAAFTLLNDPVGESLIKDYFKHYVDLALRYGVGLQLESATWRASRSWGEKLGYTKDQLEQVNHKAIELLVNLRTAYETPDCPFIISGCIGPKSDGYITHGDTSISNSKMYHLDQIRSLSKTKADMVCACTIPEYKEATGIVLAAKEVDIPVAIGFTLEIDGRLPSGQSMREAIEFVDRETQNYVSYYMINCVHPTHIMNTLKRNESWKKRIQSIRVNASCKSHAELNEAATLDEGDIVNLGLQYAQLSALLPHLNVVGGCCGTDHRHVESIIKNLLH